MSATVCCCCLLSRGSSALFTEPCMFVREPPLRHLSHLSGRGQHRAFSPASHTTCMVGQGFPFPVMLERGIEFANTTFVARCGNTKRRTTAFHARRTFSLISYQDCFFTRGEFQQLLYQALSGLPGLEIVPPSDDITTLTPAILRPQERWTGKQVWLLVGLRLFCLWVLDA